MKPVENAVNAIVQEVNELFHKEKAPEEILAEITNSDINTIREELLDFRHTARLLKRLHEVLEELIKSDIPEAKKLVEKAQLMADALTRHLFDLLRNKY